MSPATVAQFANASVSFSIYLKKKKKKNNMSLSYDPFAVEIHSTVEKRAKMMQDTTVETTTSIDEKNAV